MPPLSPLCRIKKTLLETAVIEKTPAWLKTKRHQERLSLPRVQKKKVPAYDSQGKRQKSFWKQQPEPNVHQRTQQESRDPCCVEKQKERRQNLQHQASDRKRFPALTSDLGVYPHKPMKKQSGVARLHITHFFCDMSIVRISAIKDIAC